MTSTELEDKMAVLLGGRAAEKLVFKHVSTGAADDLDKATDIAWSAVTKYAMDESLGDVVFERQQNSFLGEHSFYKARNYSEATAQKIDSAVKAMLTRAGKTAEKILEYNEELLLECATKLLEQETLSESEIKLIAEKVKRPPGLIENPALSLDH
jgi:cell division protease FtsH